MGKFRLGGNDGDQLSQLNIGCEVQQTAQNSRGEKKKSDRDSKYHLKEILTSFLASKNHLSNKFYFSVQRKSHLIELYRLLHCYTCTSKKLQSLKM